MFLGTANSNKLRNISCASLLIFIIHSAQSSYALQYSLRRWSENILCLCDFRWHAFRIDQREIIFEEGLKCLCLSIPGAKEKVQIFENSTSRFSKHLWCTCFWRENRMLWDPHPEMFERLWGDTWVSGSSATADLRPMTEHSRRKDRNKGIIYATSSGIWSEHAPRSRAEEVGGVRSFSFFPFPGEWTTCAPWWRWLSFLCSVLFSDDRTRCRDGEWRGGMCRDFVSGDELPAAGGGKGMDVIFFFRFFLSSPELFQLESLSKHGFGFLFWSFPVFMNFCWFPLNCLIFSDWFDLHLVQNKDKGITPELLVLCKSIWLLFWTFLNVKKICSFNSTESF